MSDPAAEPIICPVTPWYHKRRVSMIALLLGLSAFFFYDWKVGYPKKRAEYEVYWPQYQQLVQQEKKTGDWFKLAKEKGWPEKPHEEDWNYKIREQLIFGCLTGVIGLGMLGSWFLNSRRKLTADHESFTTPDGHRVPFSSAFHLDKRKWDNKGLAYVRYKDGNNTRKAVIDCLIHGDPAIKVLERLEANFQGELVDIVRTPPAEETAPESTDPSAADSLEQAPQNDGPDSGANRTA